MGQDRWAGLSGSPEKVSVKILLPADSPRIAGENGEHARLLAELDAKLPPIVVHRSTMRVIDGMHRLQAAMLRGDDDIDVLFFDGGAEDAFVLAVELNRAHGLPLSLSDRTAAAARIIDSHPEWSNRRIATATGLSASTVGVIRRRSTVQPAQSNARIGRDGRTRPNNSADGRRRAGELIASNPDASLREIARAAGISTSTASDVRARLERGESPVAPRQRSASQSTRGREPWPEPAEALVNLKRDPSLRFTEAGRCLLRFLDACAIDSEQWEEILQSVPSHQRDTVMNLARECAGSWESFANRLARQMDTASLPTAL